MNSWRPHDEKAPFQRNPGEESTNRTGFSAFHNDSIIDPDLAPFMSDDNSSGDEQASVFTAMERGSPNVATSENDRNAVSNLLAGLRKGRSRAGARDADTASLGGRPIPRHQRRRNLSVGSFPHTNRPSPKRSKSNSLLRSFGLGAGDIPGGSPLTLQTLAGSGPGLSKLKRSSSMRGARAPAMELNAASMQHVRRLLKQMLRDAEISRVHSWEHALIPILLQCTDDVDPNVQSGDDIDVRHYVKLKKAPGGSPGDTSYVSGVVFTKNVALKSMPRSISSPRIMIVSFAIEYARHQQHFMSLGPVIAQEREYLKNVVARIKALQPKVLLVQRGVSGLALQFLNEANIAVVYNIKESVLNAVSRCTQTRIISSVDRLAIEPTHLGKCESFDVKTYVHDGLKKSYIYISGCEPRLGCTIVLRGAKKQQLHRLKAITEFMCYVVYNLKLETSLMRDEFISIPSIITNEPFSPTADPNHKCQQTPLAASMTGEAGADVKVESIPAQVFQDEPNHFSTTENKMNALQPTATVLSAENDGFHAADEEPIPDDVPPPSYYSDMVEKHRTRVLSSSPFVQFMLPYLLMRAREQERRLAHLKRLRDENDPNKIGYEDHSTQRFELVKPEMVHGPLQRASKAVREFLFAVYDAELEKAMHFYVTQKRQWESYIAGNVNPFDPLAHQNIAVLYSLVSTITSVPCAGPAIIALGFYGDHEYDTDGAFDADCTLGQYVEDLCYGAGDICKANGCGKRMYDHHRQYVHGDGQLSVFVEKYPSKFKGLEQTILMWSVCRICGQETQVIPMSENTWRYSFGKYLELSFSSSALHARAGVCPHDIHRNHVRYFGLQNVAVRLQYDTIVLYEVIVPRPTITWKVDRDLGTKNEQYIKFQERLNRFMTSIKARLEGINIESVAAEKTDACAAELDRLLRRANEDHDFLMHKLQDKYMNAKFYEVIPMNRAVRAMWEKALEWDDAFVAFEHDFFPSEKDIRRLAALQLKRLFIERSSSTSSLTSLEDADTDTEVSNEKGLHDSEKGVPSGHMSVKRARDMMTSVVEEDSAATKSIQEKEDRPIEKLSLDDNNISTIPEAMEEAPAATPQMRAVEREEVRHLDLAVPSNPPGSPPNTTPTRDELSSSRPISPTTTRDSRVSLDSPVMQPSPLDKGVAERLEQIENDKDTNHLQPVPESRIPRPADQHARRSAGIPAPPLLRAQSHPVKSLQKENSSSSAGSIALSPGPVTAALSNLQAETPSTVPVPAKSPEHHLSDRLGTNTIKAGKILTQSLIPRSIHGRKLDSKVSTLAKHFEQLSREFQKARLMERQQRTARNRQSRLYPIASSKPVVEVYKDASEALQDKDPADDDPGIVNVTRQSTDNITTDDSKSTTGSAPTAGTVSPEDEQVCEGEKETRLDPIDTEDNDIACKGQTADAEAEASDVEPLIFDDLEGSHSLAEHPILSAEDPRLDLDLDLPKHEKTSLMKMLTSFWSERSASGWMPLEYPLVPTEHVWTDSDIIVREDEPSCIIALALSSPDYQNKLHRFRRAHTDLETHGNGSAQADRQQRISEHEDTILERSLLGNTGTNMKYSFQHGSVKAQCKIFYAESFDALRRKCGVADRFIESMSRCLKWDSKGGKTKSLFLKTLDDRFVLKSLSKVEIDHFTKFAPDYFSFMAETMFHGMPSVIAKMFGLFHVVIKNPATGVEFNWFLLVMENLFYDRQLTRRFDLKGSMRNRKIESTGEKDEVLLDENLVETIFESPLFVREHSKKLLKASVYNDTLFLSKQNVMDYSLMAGIDDQRREMVVGIIDCIRTYTWDKKLESWIKDRGKNKPTITSPRDYRNRFRVSISNYFLQAPNCWHQFQAQQTQQRESVRLETRAETNEENEIETEPVANV
ncbi:MAG: 1-phosphatidylinositol-3-phosphate 5-kinase [Bathelium mastoideum]|nr:MAG: 1-phosphatidylinositol-3-phosphate 5-kinase [Bathelium mastoideum]